MTETSWDHLKRANFVFLGLFLFGAWIRSLDLWRRADGRVRESWRECDYAAVARNFYREGMNILYPRIDWRGAGPGYAEMEFPLIPWITAALYRIFGYHEMIGRILVYAFGFGRNGSGYPGQGFRGSYRRFLFERFLPEDDTYFFQVENKTLSLTHLFNRDNVKI